MMSARVATMMLALSCSVVAGAQTVQDLPGYFAVEDLALFANGEVEVDIDLREPMAKIVAAATASEDPEFSAAMEKIHRIRVRVGSAAGADSAAIRSMIDGAANRLEQSGWYRMVSVRDGEETVCLMALESSGIIQGLTALVHDGDGEIVLVNIAGEMSSEMIGSLVGNIEQLESLRSGIAAGSHDR